MMQQLFRFLSLIALLSMGCPTPVLAHAKMLRSEPAARAVLSRGPERIRLWFSEPLESDYSWVELRDASDRVISTSKAQVTRGDRKLLELHVPQLAAGQYTVHFRVLSVDGHVVRSQFRFLVRSTSQ